MKKNNGLYLYLVIFVILAGLMVYIYLSLLDGEKIIKRKEKKKNITGGYSIVYEEKENKI